MNCKTTPESNPGGFDISVKEIFAPENAIRAAK